QDLEAPALVQARRILEWIASTRPAPRFPEQQETYLEKLRQYVQWRSKRQQWVRRVQVALRVVLCVYSVLPLLVYGATIYQKNKADAQKKLADQRSWEIGAQGAAALARFPGREREALGEAVTAGEGGEVDSPLVLRGLFEALVAGRHCIQLRMPDANA